MLLHFVGCLFGGFGFGLVVLFVLFVVLLFCFGWWFVMIWLGEWCVGLWVGLGLDGLIGLGGLVGLVEFGFG